jgi:hypothetical protein
MAALLFGVIIYGVYVDELSTSPGCSTPAYS